MAGCCLSQNTAMAAYGVSIGRFKAVAEPGKYTEISTALTLEW